ncbi:MAG: DUF1573 domain-containing protein [Chitinophagaceae bacterium]|nr:MAG: DUF1573 domain-containing protein [Chitinophagaceae bacterium]
MKYTFLFILTAAVLSCNVTDKKDASGQAASTVAADGKAALSDSASTTTITWLDPEVQNLGAMKKGQVAEISWKFKNTGDKPLYIANVTAGCGCTTPDVPREPIAPGAESVIKAKFNSENFSGHVTKEVYVMANNSNRNNGTNNKLSFTADIK